MDGSSVVLHTRFSSVVFPAFALPITRMRKWVYLARSFAASSRSTVTAGATTGGATTAEGEFGRLWGVLRSPTTEGEFERLWGVLRDPSPMAFFSRLRIPLDSLAVCLRLSAISVRVENSKSERGEFLVTPDHRLAELRVLFMEGRVLEHGTSYRCLLCVPSNWRFIVFLPVLTKSLPISAISLICRITTHQWVLRISTLDANGVSSLSPRGTKWMDNTGRRCESCWCGKIKSSGESWKGDVQNVLIFVSLSSYQLVRNRLFTTVRFILCDCDRFSNRIAKGHQTRSGKRSTLEADCRLEPGIDSSSICLLVPQLGAQSHSCTRRHRPSNGYDLCTVWATEPIPSPRHPPIVYPSYVYFLR